MEATILRTVCPVHLVNSVKVSVSTPPTCYVHVYGQWNDPSVCMDMAVEGPITLDLSWNVIFVRSIEGLVLVSWV